MAEELIHEPHIVPTTLALLPLKGVVLLPKSIIPIIVGRQSSIQAVEHALKNNNMIFVTSQKEADTENPTLADVFAYGTRSIILQVMRMPKGTLKILVEGVCRSKVTQEISSEGFISVSYEDAIQQEGSLTLDVQAGWRELQHLYATYAQYNQKVPIDLLGSAQTIEEIDTTIDTVAGHIASNFEDRQKILEIVDLKKRLILL